MNPYLNLTIFAIIIISISYSIGFIRNKRLKLIAKIVWTALLILFLAWYSLDFWRPVELSMADVP